MSRIIAFDTETTGLNPHLGARPFLFAYTDGTTTVATRDKEEVRAILEDDSIIKVMHNAKFDIHMMHYVGIEVKGRVYCTQVMSHLFNENLVSDSLEYLSDKLLGKRKLVNEIDEFFKAQKTLKANRCYADIPEDIIVPYAKQDVLLTLDLFKYFYPYLKDKGLLDLLDAESDLTNTLTKMEQRGILVDIPYLHTVIKDLEVTEEALQKKILTIGGQGFNSNSSKQLGELLEKHGAIVPRTAKGNYCTDVGALIKIDTNLSKLVLSYRKAHKDKKTYGEGLLTLAVDGVIHSDLDQGGARTGRFSCSKPNLQNVPKKDSNIRKAFICREGFKNFYIDYKQMEYRVFADYANEKVLIDAIKDGVDFHRVVADIVGLLGDEGRNKAKTLNFGLLYGMGVQALARSLKVSVEEAVHIREKYFNMFNNAMEFINAVKNTIETRGYIFNKFKRRRRLEADESYKAVNALIQGCCADIIKVGMIRVDKLLDNYKSNLLLMVHDELVIEVAEGEEFLIEQVVTILEDWGHMFSVPIEVDVEYTDTNWAEKKEWITHV